MCKEAFVITAQSGIIPAVIAIAVSGKRKWPGMNTGNRRSAGTRKLIAPTWRLYATARKRQGRDEIHHSWSSHQQKEQPADL